MKKISDIIEEFIKDMLIEAENGMVEIKRNELAQYFRCSPSQINYVLDTRFGNDKGYFIESKRGGGGYIKIIKVNINKDKYIEDMILSNIGDSITKSRAYSIIDNLYEEGLINTREMHLMKVAIGDRALNIVSPYKNRVRSNILKDMILVLIRG
ncbi:CtsR family transcriptional regulator [Clostridiisalibacter paucivorans]|uniref:CtsR family transcriptional regulator n=1 Tax=Clostridiisalibacter paucivorans TaxID=408753 RepID=UPI00047DD2F5|nr:CtsR family transcriptional regulator [Clostridiisalibacter paucivorans]